MYGELESSISKISVSERCLIKNKIKVLLWVLKKYLCDWIVVISKSFQNVDFILCIQAAKREADSILTPEHQVTVPPS